MLECVPNVAEGRDAQVLDELRAACGPSLLDLHADADHHRSVCTLAGPGPRDAFAAAQALAYTVHRTIDLGAHAGVHPRLGALDVVPFVALREPIAAAIDAAHAFADWIAAKLAVPVFMYDAADPAGRSLPDARRSAFRDRDPDRGPREPHPRLGAVAVGARLPLVAVNCWLDDPDPARARAVAAEVRERDGGLPGVRALGFPVPGVGASQVSMNLVDLERCGVETACTEVRRRVEGLGGAISRVELVGLMPATELIRCSAGFLAWAGFGAHDTIEARLASARP